MMNGATGAQLRAARALLRIKQRDLAAQLGVSVLTVQRAEDDYPGSVRTKRQLQAALIAQGIEFSADGGIRPTVAAFTRATETSVAELVSAPAHTAAPERAPVIERRGGLIRVDGVSWPASMEAQALQAARRRTA